MGLGGDIEYLAARLLTLPDRAWCAAHFGGVDYLSFAQDLGGDRGWQILSRFVTTAHFPGGRAVQPDVHT